MISRRSFCRTMALLAAGAAALPEQVDAYERLFLANTPSGLGFRAGKRIALIQDFICGFAGNPHDRVMEIELLRGGTPILFLPLNYRASFRWVAVPNTPVVAFVSDVRWNIRGLSHSGEDEFLAPDASSEAQVAAETFKGTLIYTTEDLTVHHVPLHGASGSLEEAERLAA